MRKNGALLTPIDSNNTTLIDLGFATVSLIELNIINTNIITKYTINLEQAKLLLDAYLKVGNGQKLPHLITASKFVIMEKEVMEFVSTEANKYGKADAFVIQTLAQKIIANFYIKFHKPKVPTKFFQSKEKALNWLKTF